MNDLGKIRLYNTLSGKKEEFVPINSGNVRMYVCGPTVYDNAHIGNARPIIVFDVLYRLLCHFYGEEHVTYVRNITDVDDKINARAEREGVSIRSLTDRTAAQFHKDIKALGALPPNVEPRATDHIIEMKELIEQLISNDNAYVADNHVLFDVSSMPDYGKLSKKPLDELIAGARVDVASYKKNQTDFVLWKPSKQPEPSWPSPAGIEIEGRPGWHIECSAMAKKHLGVEFDIHGGGIDLVFPHHENEIAQSRCGFGTEKMANIWMHNGYLNVEGEKMSKSLGNFITIADLLETEKFGDRRWQGEVLRLAMLMTDYRKPIDWSLKRLKEAESILDGWYRNLLPLAKQTAQDDKVDPNAISYISDDLNIHRAITHILGKENSPQAATSSVATLKMLGLMQHSSDQWFSFSPKLLKIDEKKIESEISLRLKAIAENNWAEADKIRSELDKQGVQLLDSKNDAGKRITQWEMKK